MGKQVTGDHGYRIGVRLTAEEHERMEAMTKRMGCTISELVRMLLADCEVVTTTIEIPVIRIGKWEQAR